MKKFTVLIAFFCSYMLGVYGQNSLKLWYEQPAKEWIEALPLGNGRIGAMVFGRVEDELIQLNEGTLWSGGPRKDNVNPEAHRFLEPVREALRTKDFQTAQQLARKMQGHFSESFLPMADLRIKQVFPTSGGVSAYYRDLDIEQAVASVRYTQGGVSYSREMYASAPSNVLVVRYTASQPGRLNLSFSIDSQLKHTVTAEGRDELHLWGKAPARVDPSYYNPPNRNSILWEDTTGCNVMRVRTVLKVVPRGGSLVSSDTGIEVSNADEVLLYLTAATSFNGFDKCPDSEGKDEAALAKGYLSNAVSQDVHRLKQAHIDDYRSLFDRLQFRLHRKKADTLNARLPSDLRLKLYSYGNVDLGLEELYFQFGRYLLIAASRPGGAPANLQGIWNKDFRPPWSSNYTININTQMNYWPAESANLSELHRPLLDFVMDLSKTGARTAHEYYRARGWVAHQNSDIWALSNAVGNLGDGDPVWANWYMGGAWLSQHLWEHYAFNGDRAYLKRVYPVLKEAALFCVDWLVERDGYLVTSPSTSPENLFWYGGKQISVSEGATMDMAIIRDLFGHVIQASKILGVDRRFRKALEDKLSRLYPYKIGAQGQLQEWMEDYVDVDPHHRHLSHLFGLHPGKYISPLRTPDLAAAAARAFELRGDEGTGWSKAWKINFAARLLNGDHAYKMIREIMRFSDPSSVSGEKGGTYPNFFDAHPPFQIDGNFGATAGFIEMLVQSHLDEIHLLPALPSAWPAGEMKGIKARGNFEVDVHWDNGRLSKARIRSISGKPCVVRTANPIEVADIAVPETKEGEYYVYKFDTEVGRDYVLVSSL